MLRKNPAGDYPDIDKTCYIDPSAIIIGKVKLGKNVFVGPGAVIRADEEKSFIVIEDNCNIQDRVIIHALNKSGVVIRENTSLSHGCIIHGPCKIGKECFIGFGSVIFNSLLGDKVFVRFMAGVEGINIESGLMIPSGVFIDTEKKIKALKPAPSQSMKFNKAVLKANLRLVKGYKREKAT